jgi:hypothetical protein
VFVLEDRVMRKRDFLAAAAGLALATAAKGQPDARPPIPRRKARTKVLFHTPPGLPNALAATPEGLWIGEQKMSGALAKQYNVPDATDLREAAWLVDWNGKLLKTVMTQSRNTSGMAVGGGYIWMGAEFAPPHDGIFQTGMDGKLIAQRQVPLGPAEDGGGVHGALWHDGKLWLLSNRLHAIMRVDPASWTTEFMIPLSKEADRYHAIAWDSGNSGGAIWAVTGNNSKSFATATPGLHKYDAASGKLLEIVDFVPGSADPHGLAMHDGKLISCDAGIHPGWPNNDSPFHGTVFEIELI